MRKTKRLFVASENEKNDSAFITNKMESDTSYVLEKIDVVGNLSKSEAINNQLNISEESDVVGNQNKVQLKSANISEKSDIVDNLSKSEAISNLATSSVMNTQSSKVINNHTNSNNKMLIPAKNLKILYGRSYRFARLYAEDLSLLKIFGKYLIKQIAADYKKSMTIIMNGAMAGRSDFDIYMQLRKITNKQSGNLEQSKVRKIGELHSATGLEKIERVLDIGTESLDFLDSIAKTFPGAEVNGINVSAGFCHYDEKFLENSSDKRFQLYDGKTIPFDDQTFDIVTLFSVIHHIDPENFMNGFAEEITRVSRRWIFIKEVDLSTTSASDTFDIQHETFEGILFPGTPSYRNSNITFDFVESAFAQNGFVLREKKDWGNFNKTYFALFEKLK